MGTGQLLAGNLASLGITVLAFLQVIPWDIAGYLIIISVILVTLGYLRSAGQRSTPGDETASAHETDVREFRVQKPATHLDKRTSERSSEHREPPPKTVIAKGQTEKIAEEEPERKPGEGPSTIGEGDYLSYDVDLEQGEEVVGEVSASSEVNVYVLNEDNLDALDMDQEFWYEAGNEGVRNTTVRFTAPEDGVWYVVVENDNSHEVNATVKVSVGRPSHSPPSLRTDALELPDAKLEGKL